MHRSVGFDVIADNLVNIGGIMEKREDLTPTLYHHQPSVGQFHGGPSKQYTWPKVSQHGQGAQAQSSALARTLYIPR
jgi:hypothetical protein